MFTPKIGYADSLEKIKQRCQEQIQLIYDELGGY